MEECPVEEPKRVRVVKRKLRERRVLHFNPNLPHLHLFYQSEESLSPETTHKVIHQIVMCFYVNYKIGTYYE